MYIKANVIRVTEMKKCSLCKTEKPRDNFSWQNKKKNKVMSACKLCNRTRQKEKRAANPEAQRIKDNKSYQKHKEHRVNYARVYRKENPDKTRATNLKAKYGITAKDYDDMFALQEGRCKICSADQSELKRILCVDHCHSSGKIRGLLCDTCNKFLGFYEKLHKQCKEYLS